MSSPAGIFTNSIPMAFFSAPVCATICAPGGTCAKRQVTATANVPTETNLMCLSPPWDIPSDPVPSVLSVVEKELGLKLESKKVPFDVLVIDHLDREPSTN